MRSDRLPQQRLELAGWSEYGMAEVVVLGRANFTNARQPLRPHRHPGVLEICYLASGRQVFSAEGQDYVLTGGDMFVTQPGEGHSTNGSPRERSVLYWLQLDLPREPAPFLNLPPEEAEAMRRHLLSLPGRHFTGAPVLKQVLDDIIEIRSQPIFPLRPTYLRHKVIEFLLNVLNCAQHVSPPRLTDDVRQVMSLIDANLDQGLSIPVLARSVGLSTPRLRAKFKAQTGLPIADYILRKKISRSIQYLQDSRWSITEVAHQLGFSSSQYFSTTFKRYTGKTPSEVLSDPAPWYEPNRRSQGERPGITAYKR